MESCSCGPIQFLSQVLPFLKELFFFFFKDCKLLGNNLEGWDGEEGGKDVQMGGDPSIPMADSC